MQSFSVRTFEQWRAVARPLLADAVRPEEIEWLDSMEPPSRGALPEPVQRRSENSFAKTDPVPERLRTAPASPPAEGGSVPLKLSRSLLQLLEAISHYRHPGRWELMYRLAWRSLHENRRILEDEADPDVRHAQKMERAVNQACHKMHAFVRFREIRDHSGALSYFAWFESPHEVLRRGAPFFARRFPNMDWTIATPDGAAVCERGELRFIDAPSEKPQHLSDSHESLWRTYYRSICNVARINPTLMQREMPQRYWRHLPESTEIPTLIRDGQEKFAQRHSEVDDTNLRMAKAIQRSLAELPPPAEGPAACKRCELWRHATQAVTGEGPEQASIMLVGEQPGDEEDLRGKAFIGPAGKVLDEAIAAAGLARGDVFITNAVKHFKWEPRGKRRLHRRPDVAEIMACNVWLEREITAVQPRVIVALGATALRALTGLAESIESARQQSIRHRSGARIVCTYHPSAILRAADGKGATLRRHLVADLQRARHE